MATKIPCIPSLFPLHLIFLRGASSVGGGHFAAVGDDAPRPPPSRVGPQRAGPSMAVDGHDLLPFFLQVNFYEHSIGRNRALT